MATSEQPSAADLTSLIAEARHRVELILMDMYPTTAQVVADLCDAAETALRYQFAPMGDNHHNAFMCPYCSPQLQAERDAAAERVRATRAAFKDWMTRTNGEETPNEDERYGMMIERARFGNSFTAEDVLWLDNYLRTRTQESGYEKQVAGPLPRS